MFQKRVLDNGSISYNGYIQKVERILIEDFYFTRGKLKPPKLNDFLQVIGMVTFFSAYTRHPTKYPANKYDKLIFLSLVFG